MNNATTTENLVTMILNVRDDIARYSKHVEGLTAALVQDVRETLDGRCDHDATIRNAQDVARTAQTIALWMERISETRQRLDELQRTVRTG